MYKRQVYKEVKRTADSVTLEGYDPARQLFISKTYTLHPVKNLEGEIWPGSKYLMRLTVSLLNKSPNVQDLRYMGIFGGSAYPIAKSEPKMCIRDRSTAALFRGQQAYRERR